MVEAVVETPFGAHPTGVYRYYEHDVPHIQRYHDASRDPAAFRGYLEEYVFGVRDEWDYLARIGPARLLRLRVDPSLGYIPRLGGSTTSGRPTDAPTAGVA